MPTQVSTDSLYDASSKVFYPYTTNTAYINPYSSDRQGGELITEYNQRNALNTLCKKDMQFQEFATELKERLDVQFGANSGTDPVTGEPITSSAGLLSFKDQSYGMLSYWHATMYATGVRDESDFDLRYDAGKLYVKAGKAMINGYNIDSSIEISMDIGDVITEQDVRDVSTRPSQNPANPIASKFIKLAVMYVTTGEHDERLNPPLDGEYKSVAIIVNNELLKDNELLLGTITRSSQGEIFLMPNPLKTRILPLDAVAGAEGYDELVNTANMEDGHIYGLRSDVAHHITDITSKLWLDSGSNIAKLLKALSAQPETATVDYYKNTRALITTVGFNNGSGDSNSALRATYDDFPSIVWHQAYALENDANATIEMREIYYPFAYCDDTVIQKEEVPRPRTSAPKQYVYNDISCPEISGRTGKSGFMTGQQAFMLEKAYKHCVQPSDAGIQYGPFVNLEDAVKWFALHADIEYKVGDYFWVINDSIVVENKTVTASFGTVSGSVTGNVSGTVTGQVTGTTDYTGQITGSVTGTVSTDPPSTVTGDVTGTAVGTAVMANTAVVGTVSGTTAGVVTGQLDAMTQNVSTRYACIYSGPGTVGTNRGVRRIVDRAHYNPGTQEPTFCGSIDKPVTTEGKAWFALQAVERGFGIPASKDMYGLVKAARETENIDPLDVVINNVTKRLNVNTALYNTILNGGFTTYSDDSSQTDPNIDIAPGDLLENLNNKMFTQSQFTLRLTGSAADWENVDDSVKTLKHVRGHIILDYSGLVIDNEYTGNIIFRLSDVDWVTLKGDNSTTDNHTPTRSLKLGFDHCVVDTPFFENIGSWKSSSFTSGSNTIELNNPWMTVDKIFSENDYIKNKLCTRFSSVTIGENGISSAMMDMWIQYENTQPDSRSVDHCWVSRMRMNFPPLMCEFEDGMEEGSSVTTHNIDQSTIQHIPGDISMKIGATAGVHEVITAQNEGTQVYTPAGNLLATVDWSYNTHYDINNAPAEQLYLNLYMKNSSGESMQKISNLKFRVPVQVTRMSDNSSVRYATYSNIYQSEPEVVS